MTTSRHEVTFGPTLAPRKQAKMVGMQLDPLTLVLAGISIVIIAMLIAVIAGTLAARLFFHASGLGDRATTEGEDSTR